MRICPGNPGPFRAFRINCSTQRDDPLLTGVREGTNCLRLSPKRGLLFQRLSASKLFVAPTLFDLASAFGFAAATRLCLPDLLLEFVLLRQRQYRDDCIIELLLKLAIRPIAQFTPTGWRRLNIEGKLASRGVDPARRSIPERSFGLVAVGMIVSAKLLDYAHRNGFAIYPNFAGLVCQFSLL
jgi:hypothetical protein